ncbi:hypothetical protein B0H67DRAFT_40447 [Lasiosphaeris hirsuta]|uniref:Uncharacterized protein n=1 Tax=Lasiosphaeris hirsuta TaxID=260670 RepID=A0AA40BAB6_9PEZI|nr:hypothetical protein B0H67DRAFT_40447 [Lasiosphaeris hirsuta]
MYCHCCRSSRAHVGLVGFLPSTANEDISCFVQRMGKSVGQAARQPRYVLGRWQIHAARPSLELSNIGVATAGAHRYLFHPSLFTIAFQPSQLLGDLGVLVLQSSRSRPSLQHPRLLCTHCYGLNQLSHDLNIGFPRYCVPLPTSCAGEESCTPPANIDMPLSIHTIYNGFASYQQTLLGPLSCIPSLHANGPIMWLHITVRPSKHLLV